LGFTLIERLEMKDVKLTPEDVLTALFDQWADAEMGVKK
jgi:hypothetical protein